MSLSNLHRRPLVALGLSALLVFAQMLALVHPFAHLPFRQGTPGHAFDTAHVDEQAQDAPFERHVPGGNSCEACLLLAHLSAADLYTPRTVPLRSSPDACDTWRPHVAPAGFRAPCPPVRAPPFRLQSMV
ncbi:MAG: hypothetical protein KDK91_11170 [Gammaproteobacteria bacterium]|nr:hypothetical protein [Gammaproteobacteria bacterium]